ncbi:hypothetical protein, partial [Escherichia coli]|uniref:hypothetical protein n=1 Tax=Escherichia coli TaxID=562 RepID=UPI003917D85B
MYKSGSRPSRFTPVMRASPLSCDCPAGVAEPGADALPAGDTLLLDVLFGALLAVVGALSARALTLSNVRGGGDACGGAAVS